MTMQDDPGDHPDTLIEVKSYTTKQLAVLYNVKEKVFRSWLQPHQQYIGERVGHFFTPKQVKEIFDKLGRPGYYTLLFLPLFLPPDVRHHISFYMMEGAA